MIHKKPFYLTLCRPDWFLKFPIENTLLILIIECDTLSASFWRTALLLTTVVYTFDLLYYNESITMFPDKINQNSFVYITLSGFYGADPKFFIFWKTFSLTLKDEQIKKFTCQPKYPIAMATGQVEFSSHVSKLKS